MSSKPKKKNKLANQKSKQVSNKAFPFKIPKWALPSVLIFTAFLYFRSLFNDFAWDDEMYILNNPFIRDFSISGIKAIFSSFYFCNYHPLTTLTYLFEYNFFGLYPLPYHILNVLLHLLNTWLVYKITEKLSENKITVLVVSLFFAIHPMHVESVAWISERKDVLFTSFYLLSILVYLRYLKCEKKLKYYIGTLLLFIFSLLSKPSAVTLPVLLIVIDVYQNRKINTKILLEKIPFFLLSILFGVLTIMAQKSMGSIKDLSVSFNFFERIFLFTYTVSFYIVKLIAPFNLSIMHYFPETHGSTLPFLYYASLPFLIILFWFIIKLKSFRKDFIFGFLFFLITISITLQIIAVGNSIASERYTYIPYIGLFYLIGQWFATIERKLKRNIIFTIFSLFVILFSYQTWNRIYVWKNTETLCSDIIKKNPDKYDCYYIRGVNRGKKGDFKGAVQDFNKALTLKSDEPKAYYNRGLAFKYLNNNDSALNDYSNAIMLNPEYAEAYLNRGLLYYELKNTKSAILDYNKAIQLNPEFTVAYNNRGRLLYESGDMKSAMLDYNEATRLNPEFAYAYSNRALVKAKTGDTIGAFNDVDKAMTLSPDNAEIYYTRGSIKTMQKDYEGSIEDYNYSLKLNPNDNRVYYDRGMILLNLKDTSGACEDLKKALELGHDDSLKLSKYCH
ncbi:MAG: tetratricopeptide repeat protein [Bacteroidota bacterium]